VEGGSKLLASINGYGTKQWTEALYTILLAASDKTFISFGAAFSAIQWKQSGFTRQHLRCLHLCKLLLSGVETGIFSKGAESCHYNTAHKALGHVIAHSEGL